MIKLINAIVITIYAITALTKLYGQQKIETRYALKINVNYELSMPGDTMILYLAPQAIQDKIAKKYIGIVDKKGNCTFKIITDYPQGILAVSKIKMNPNWKNDSNLIMYNIYWESGDDIYVSIKDSRKKEPYEKNTIFSGKGAEKYCLIYQLREEERKIQKEEKNDLHKPGFYNNQLSDTLALNTQRTKRLISLLDSNKAKISPFIYDVLKTDILMMDYSAPITSLQYSIPTIYANERVEIREQLIKQLFKIYLPVPNFQVSKEALAASYRFQNFYGNLFILIPQLKNRGNSKFEETVKLINDNLTGVEKESILLSSLNLIGIQNDKREIKILQPFIKTALYNQMLRKHLNLSKQNVFGYSFFDTAGRSIDLTTFKGKLVLFDFWYTGCGNCIYFYQQLLSKIEEEYKSDSRFMIVSVSSDKDHKKWLKSIATEQYTNSEVTNLYTGSIGELHPFYNDFGIYKSPFAILIDQNGNIVEFDTKALTQNKESLSSIIKKYLL